MKFLLFSLFLTVLRGQQPPLFIDGVAAVVEDNIVLKSDLNQMVNMMAIQRGVNPNENFDQYMKLKDIVLESMVDQKILLEKAKEDTTIENDNAIAVSLNNVPEIPLMKINGKKTATKINVVAIIANEICFEPL